MKEPLSCGLRVCQHSENSLPNRSNQWSNAESRLANQDKRLKSIIISCLPNDVMKSVIKCKTAKEMWNDLILVMWASEKGDYQDCSLEIKFNAFKSLKGEQVNGTFTRLTCLLNDLENNGVTIPQAEVNAMEHQIRAFMAIAEDEPSVGKADAKSRQWVDITMKKVHRLLSMTDGDERKHVLDYTHVDLHYVEDQRKSLVIPENIVKALGGKGRRKEKISSKKVVFTKADESSSMLAPEITSDAESECDSQEPLPPLPKLIGAAPSGTSESLNSLSDLTLNMADLTLDTLEPKNTRPSAKVCPVHNHNHMDHLGKFDEKANDGFFLGYSPAAKSFREYVISEDPPKFTEANNHPALNEPNQTESADLLEPAEPQTNVICEPITDVQPLPTISPSTKVIL
ncbi:hypothetical protein Tco_0825280 [Tanacetum coccineum]